MFMMHCAHERVYGVFFFFQAEDGIRDWSVTGVQTCALPILAQTILVTEYFFNGKWDALTAPGAQTQTAIKSHRPITPFEGLTGTDVYSERSEERRVGKECRSRGAAYR